MLSALKHLPATRWAVLEHDTNGDKSVICFDCELIRNDTCLKVGLVWIDRSHGTDSVKLKPRSETTPLITIEFPAPLKNQATGQVIADVIFRIDSIIDKE